MSTEGVVGNLVIRVTTQESRVRQAGDRLTAVESAVEALAEWRVGVDAVLDQVQGSPVREPVVDWMTIITVDLAVGSMEALCDWVPAVYLPYGDPLAPCWPWHPAVVTRLLSLRAMHRKAVASKVPDDFSAWFKLRDEVAGSTLRWMGSCDTHTHHGWQASWRVDVDQVEAYAAWWASQPAGRRAIIQDAPGLTRKQ